MRFHNSKGNRPGTVITKCFGLFYTSQCNFQAFSQKPFRFSILHAALYSSVATTQRQRCCFKANVGKKTKKTNSSAFPKSHLNLPENNLRKWVVIS